MMPKLILLLAFFTLSAAAQSLEAPVYVEQFANLSASLDRIYPEATKDPANRQTAQALQSRIFALQKTAHHLQEEAGQVNLEELKQSRRNDKRLLLIQQGCMSVDAILAALSSYLDTDDRLFLGLAADLKQTISTINKVL